MASHGKRLDETESGSGQLSEDDRAGERVYDSFVVRLWREVGNPRLLRVEVDHAQSGSTATARGAGGDWIGARIAALLGGSRAPPDRREAGLDAPPN